MEIQRDTADERQDRLDRMIKEFQDAKKRALVKRGVALWNRTEQKRALMAVPPPPDTIN